MPSGKKSRLWNVDPKIFQELTVGQIAERFGMSMCAVRRIKTFHQDKKKAEVIPKEDNSNGNEAPVRLRPVDKGHPKGAERMGRREAEGSILSEYKHCKHSLHDLLKMEGRER